ncbi:MAG: hypothetical protein JRJ05_10875 [Deltaproteobacteria bacterium]|nr:hypothetical protein [Deltaproteobacteria bacterium]
MEDYAYIGELLSAIFYLVVGARLLKLASQTRQVPERLLGALFLFSGASYLAYVCPMVFAEEWLWTPLNFLERVLYLPVPALLAIFTRRVFRPDSRWAAWLVWICIVLPVAGVGASVLGGDWEGYALGNTGFWAEWTGYTFPFCWAGVEAFSQYATARRRRKHGLCDPVVCNRFLLWGIYGVTSVIGSLLILPMYAHYERYGEFAAIWDRLTGVAEISSIAVVCVVFFAPAFYERWVNGAAPAATAEED